MDLIINYRGKKFKLYVRKLSSVGKYMGLMFKRSKTKNLLFEYAKNSKTGIHSFFVFFEFFIIWLDDKNNILDFRIVKPFEFYINTKKEFRKFIEIPLNAENRKIVEFFFGRKAHEMN